MSESKSQNAIIEAASRNQHDAAQPSQSVWVSANAGTGKTRVLTERILRLLVDGAATTDILAVTYTRAAAAEMRNRLYERLARWAVIDEADLSKDIESMGVERPSQKQLARGRRLFAELLDAPVSIRIETVHAFAQSVLRRFPVEANIQPYFELATQSQSRSLKDEAIADAMGADNRLAAQSLHHLAQVMNEEQIISHAELMFDYPKLLRRIADDPVGIRGELFTALDCQDASDNPEEAIADCIDGVMDFDDGLARRLTAFAEACSDGGKTDQKHGQMLTRILTVDSKNRQELFDVYTKIFLTGEYEGRKRPASKDVLKANSDFLHLIGEQVQVLQSAHKRLNSIKTAQLTMALYVVAAEMAVGYRKRKVDAGLMDYDDLISTTVDLFDRDGGTSWVRYKLDRGIEHLLIDEAQDTSPSQWKILSSLAEEFFNQVFDDDDSDQPSRSLFSVGDYKQSIYSFQGAEPDLFHAQEEKFSALATQTRKAFKRVNLTASFRSTAPVLELVDEVSPALDGLGQRAEHQVSRIGDGGFVEILDVIQNPDADAPAPFTPHRHNPASSPELMLAEKIVDTLKAWIGTRYLPSRGRVMRAGDVMILSRRRDEFGKILDRMIRQAGLPLAGADRVKLKDNIAVMDLAALGQVMLLPEDDLTLAAVLKSPLFELSEDKLLTLAHGRKGKLISRLAELAEQDEGFGKIHKKFNEWLGLAEISTPYEFYRGVLRGEVQRRFSRRMGKQVLDILGEFLDVVRDYEDVHAPSMQGFLAMLATSEIEITRENTEGDDEIRIMTIHGAKGLEAPVVILPDTLTNAKGPHSTLIDLDTTGETYPIKFISDGLANDKVQEAKDKQQQLDDEEQDRLLYVALTRAEDGLLVAGFEAKRRRRYENSWYEKLRNAAEALPDCQRRPDGDGVMVQKDQTAPVRSESIPEEKSRKDESSFDLPPWLFEQAPQEVLPRPALTPSSFGESHTPAGRGRQQAMLRGSLTHRLLEVLPQLDKASQQRAIGRITAPYALGPLDAEAIDQAVKSTLTLLEDERLGSLFGENSRAEVPISGMVDHHVVSGIIDRLVVSDDEVIIIDFKTGQPPDSASDLPPAYIQQLNLYGQVIGQIWPSHALKSGLIYTEDGSIHWIDATSC